MRAVRRMRGRIDGSGDGAFQPEVAAVVPRIRWTGLPLIPLRRTDRRPALDPTRRRPHVLVEGCVTSPAEAAACASAGAGRVELCVDLDVGGLTPPVGLVSDVRGAVAVPVFVMVRPRPGDFVPVAGEIARMAGEIDAVRDAGADGIVLGVLDMHGRVDRDAVRHLVEAAGPLPVTFHRAFDGVADPEGALETLVDVGVARVLTSGGAASAIDGAGVLERLVRRAAGRIVVMPGGRVRADHAAELVRRTGAREVHARAEAVAALVRSL